MTKLRATLAVAPLTLTLIAGCGADDDAGRFEGQWSGPHGSNITLKTDGTAKGYDGCNEFAARWKARSGTTGSITITESSDVGCPPNITSWDEATNLALFEDRLLIEGSDGGDLADLTR